MHDAQITPDFSGSIPELYDRHLVPLLFEGYAHDLVRRVQERGASRLLEVAAGTGVVTRALADGTPASTALTATDLSQPMIDQAEAAGASRPVSWGQADAMDLPFEDESFDIVVSQFGVMFVPDKPRGFAEMRRVLRPGGVIIVSVWDRLESNGFSDAAQAGLEQHFPEDPPRFLPDAAFGYHDKDRISSDFAAAGFAEGVEIEAVDQQSRVAIPEVAAVALCQAGPVRNEIEDRDPVGLEAATASVTSEIRDRYGSTDLVAPMRAFLATAHKT